MLNYMCMSRVTSKAISRTPSKSSSSVKASKPTTRRVQLPAAKKADSAKLSNESKKADSAEPSSLLNGIKDWAGGDNKAKDAAGSEKAKSMSLDKGQFLRKGGKGEKINQLQELLNSKGAKLDVDGKFGPKTQAALKKFQASNDLGADGVVGPKTLEKLNAQSKPDATKENPKAADGSKETKKTEGADTGKEATTKETGKAETEDKAKKAATLALGEGEFLRKGASGDKINQLQEMLNSKGANLDVDGKFGSKTMAALKKFQSESGLGSDGVVGPNTLAKLNGTEVPNQGKAEQTGAADQTGQVGQAGKGRFKTTREALNKLPKALRKYADTFQKAGEKYGVDPRFLAAISMHETGNGTSSAFRNKKNAMGISNRSGPIRMSSVEASIDKMARGLAKKTGYYRGKTTIGGVANIYAPVGAKNDPTGLNGYWAKGVAKNFRKFGGNPSQQVIFR